MLFLLSSCSEIDTSGTDTLERDTCASCHTIPPESGIHFLTEKSSYEYSCSQCHKGYRADSVVVTSPTDHMNGVVNVSYVGLPGQTGVMQNATCSNIDCHGASRANVSGITWNSSSKMGDTVGCQTCHSTGVGAATGHKAGSPACFSCHSTVVAGPVEAMTIIDFNKHINGTLDF